MQDVLYSIVVDVLYMLGIYWLVRYIALVLLQLPSPNKLLSTAKGIKATGNRYYCRHNNQKLVVRSERMLRGTLLIHNRNTSAIWNCEFDSRQGHHYGPERPVLKEV